MSHLQFNTDLSTNLTGGCPTTELNRIDGVTMVRINPDLSTESRIPELSEPIKLAINEHSQPKILPRLLGSVLEEEFDHLPGFGQRSNNASLKGYLFPKAEFLKINSINHSTFITKGTTLGTCLVKISTSGKIESALAAYQGNGVIEYMSEVITITTDLYPTHQPPKQVPLKTYNKEPTGRVDSGEQEAVPALEVLDDCTSPLSSLEIGKFSNHSLKPLQLPNRSNQYTLRVVYHQT
ncbi:hypothetical protein BY996DRAFT_6617668 [Phakopsora pachyrhizi]|uniref:Uncharacterized protein n=1 Tax=Phakopsora pachyrhizi TaxID=170000 RepID=A0AAV0AHX3_PHAPC|nr:hypothetical protein BY996DRAFT_6617668 [Phakopsora pachyrhizi]CAH7666298.1 hypothetical protein PPACK8108_LOCUS643 [Phakopsora pachyrhizi]